MQIKANYPTKVNFKTDLGGYRDGLAFWENTGYIYEYHPDTGKTSSYFPWAVPADVYSILDRTIDSAVARDSSSMLSTDNQMYFGPLLLSASGDPIRPVEYTLNLGPVRSGSYKEYLLAQKTNKIYVNDFFTAQLKGKLSPIEKILSYGVKNTSNRLPWQSGLWSASGEKPQYIIADGRHFSFTFRIVRQIQNRQQLAPPSAAIFDPIKCLESIGGALVKLKPDTGMVTGVAAKANDGVQDALTSLAELPETLVSVGNGCKTIVKMFKETKAKEFRLRNQVKKNLKGKTERETALLLKELADAIAQVWLTYRLEIYPTVKSTESILLDNLKEDHEFYRYRDSIFTEFSHTYEGLTFTFPVKDRCFIKRSYNPDKPLSRYGWNPFKTAFELIPLSFILNRYITIGDFIASLTAPKLHLEQGATYSWKVTATDTANHVDGWNFSVELSSYRRKVINPDHYCGITFPDDRSPMQLMDQWSIAWLMLTSGLPKKLRN